MAASILQHVNNKARNPNPPTVPPTTAAVSSVSETKIL